MTAQTEPRRILVVALDNLGDLVFASALVPPIRQAFPSASIGVWCKEYTAPVARLIPHVDEVFAGDPLWAVSPGRPRPSLRAFLRSLLAVRQAKFDAAILSAAPWRTAAACAASGIPVRVGLERHRNAAFLTRVLPPEDPAKPVLVEQARLLTGLGISSNVPRYHLDASRLGTVRDEVSKQLAHRFVALHPFAGTRDRCVPLGEWTQVAFALQGRGLRTLWVGTTRELDELRRSVTHPGGYYVDRIRASDVNEGSLTVTAAAISLAAGFVGHDSGPLHVAGALGVPVVGVFAPGEPKRTFPQGIAPWRMIHRAAPGEITAADLLREVADLGLFSGP
jgi:ADP-heptose:LPS heptosyltransferase